MRSVVVGPSLFALFACVACSSSSSPSGGGDAGSTSDSGGSDSAVMHDSGGDSGPTVQGCGASDFVDKSDPAAMRIIRFPVDFNPVQFNPPCMKIKAGQTVEWQGSFTNHPLEAMGGDSGNPIMPTNMGTDVMVTFPNAGTFGYDCANHPSIMHGAILVVP